MFFLKKLLVLKIAFQGLQRNFEAVQLTCTFVVTFGGGFVIPDAGSIPGGY